MQKLEESVTYCQFITVCCILVKISVMGYRHGPWEHCTDTARKVINLLWLCVLGRGEEMEGVCAFLHLGCRDRWIYVAANFSTH